MRTDMTDLVAKRVGSRCAWRALPIYTQAEARNHTILLGAIQPGFLNADAQSFQCLDPAQQLGERHRLQVDLYRSKTFGIQALDHQPLLGRSGRYHALQACRVDAGAWLQVTTLYLRRTALQIGIQRALFLERGASILCVALRRLPQRQVEQTSNRNTPSAASARRSRAGSACQRSANGERCQCCCRRSLRPIFDMPVILLSPRAR